MSTIDVVIPCYAYGRFLWQCVSSVVDQSFRDVRVLIIDDASPDDTSAIASVLMSGDPRIQLLRHKTNKGHIYTYNEGIDWASSDYMLLLSADDFLLPGALERAAALLDAHPCAGFTFGRIVEVTGDGTTNTPDCPISLDPCSPGCVLSGSGFISISGCSNIVGTPTAVVRTGLQKDLGGYREELKHSGDMEMWLRFASRACVGFVNAVQAVYRRHAANMSLQYGASTRWPDLIQRKAAVDQFLLTCGDQLPHRREIAERLSWEFACDAVSLASEAFNEGKTEFVDEACRYAQAIRADVTSSRQWQALRWKRRIGLPAWRVLRPALTAARRRLARGAAASQCLSAVHAHAD